MIDSPESDTSQACDLFAANTPIRLILIVAAIAGLAYALITPPFYVPDEPNHFFRAWQLSELRLLATPGDPGYGGELPREVVRTPYEILADAPFNDTRTVRPADIREALTRRIDSDDRVFIHFPNTAVYSPAPYLPQILGIWIGRAADLSPLAQMYLGRLLNLAAFIGLTALALRFMPFARSALALIALLPMSIYLAGSLSADALTNASAFLLVAWTLHLAYRAPRVTAAHLTFTTLLGLLVVLSKHAYFPLLALTLLIPAGKFSSARLKWIALAAVFAVCLGIDALWYAQIHDFYALPPLVTDPRPDEQLRHLAAHPLHFFSVLARTWLADAGFARYFVEGLGHLGWLDVPLPLWLLLPLAALILAAAVLDPARSARADYSTPPATPAPSRLPLRARLLVLAILFAEFLLLNLVLYLALGPVGADEIRGLQGRYFLPLAPLVCLLFVNRRYARPLPRAALIGTAVVFLLANLMALGFVLARAY